MKRKVQVRFSVISTNIQRGICIQIILISIMMDMMTYNSLGFKLYTIPRWEKLTSLMLLWHTYMISNIKRLTYRRKNPSCLICGMRIKRLVYNQKLLYNFKLAYRNIYVNRNPSPCTRLKRCEAWQRPIEIFPTSKQASGVGKTLSARALFALQKVA